MLCRGLELGQGPDDLVPLGPKLPQPLGPDLAQLWVSLDTLVPALQALAEFVTLPLEKPPLLDGLLREHALIFEAGLEGRTCPSFRAGKSRRSASNEAKARSHLSIARLGLRSASDIFLGGPISSSHTSRASAPLATASLFTKELKGVQIGMGRLATLDNLPATSAVDCVK